MTSLSAFEIIVLIAGSSAGAVITSQALSAFRDYRKTNREAAFSALYAAIALEDYTSRCSSLISDSENYERSGGLAGAPRGNVTELPGYPDTIEWKPFGIKATNTALSFRVDVDNTRAMFRDMWEFDDEDGIAPLVREHSAKLGLEALNIAISLRHDRGLEPVDYSSEWNVKKHLEERQSYYVEKGKKQEERARDMHEKIMAAGTVDAGAHAPATDKDP